MKYSAWVHRYPIPHGYFLRICSNDGSGSRSFTATTTTVLLFDHGTTRIALCHNKNDGATSVTGKVIRYPRDASAGSRCVLHNRAPIDTKATQKKRLSMWIG